MGGFMPWLNLMPQVDQAIKIGEGAEAAVLGQPFNVYRLTSSTNVGIVTGTQLYTNFPALIDKKSKALDDQLLELIAFEVHCDARNLQLGDVLVPMNAYGSQSQDIFTIVEKRPTFETFGVRTNALATISRPNPSAGSALQQPVGGGNIAPSGWSGVWKENDLVLTLSGGLYSFSSNPAATAAQIYVAFQPNARIRDGNSLNVPTEQWRDVFAMWCPLIGGDFINELDRFNLGQGDRYQVAKFIIPDQTQFYGTIMVVEKLGGS